MSASSRDMSYAAVMARKNEIMKASMGMDYNDFIQAPSPSTTSA